MEKLRAFGQDLLELLYPRHARCMGCGDLTGTEEGWLCDECREHFVELSTDGLDVCEKCGMPLYGTKKCFSCSDWPGDGLALARFAYGYAHPVSEVVQEMKYRGVYRMTQWMGEEIAQVLEMGCFGHIDALVPVPMHPMRQRDRGRNHALCLAQEAGKKAGIPVWDILVRTRNTKQQARLKGEKRLHSLDGAFAVKQGAPELSEMRIVVIDDVITTGATANGCARVLYAAGAANVCAAAFAGHLPAQEKREA